MQKVKRLSQNQIFWPLVVFVSILLLNGIATKGAFFEFKIVDGHLYGRIIDIIRNGGKLMILAIGMTMALATGGTDISVGSVMAISGAVACSIVDGRIFPGLGGNAGVAIMMALLAGLACGAWNGFLVAKVKMQPIVATMILLVAGRGIAQLITQGKIVTIGINPAINPINPSIYYFINGGYILGLPFPLMIVIFFFLLALLFTKRTAFGLFVESIGVNSAASSFTGINVDLVKLLIYTFSGFMASVAGLIESAGIKAADCNNAGLLIELDAILAVAVGGGSLAGGRFSIASSIVGALIIQSVTTSLLAMGVVPQAALVAKSLVVIAICLAQSKSFKEAISSRFRKGAQA
ncbi:MAG: ABC transporter permease [Clostridiales bacterium]|nr:ABC transporter permease [Clostridiales bacterium]